MSIMQSFFTQAEMGIQQKIVEELLNSESNLDTKTELNNPLRWSCLSIVQEYLQTHNLTQSSSILKSFIACSFKYLISKERKGRTEYIEALHALTQAQEKEQQKLDGKI